ncbi:transposase [Nocardia sp. NPDC050630]|uniref:IS110 family transposase n=1 Tax=Nocardia sp. NPDC050630 TaxID=3364321 RepID=UPI00378D761A
MPFGRVTDESTFPTTSTGLERAIGWLARRTDGDVDGVLIAAEGTGSYGAILADRLERIGYRVVEAPTPSSKRLRDKGKTDALDALTAARSTLITQLASSVIAAAARSGAGTCMLETATVASDLTYRIEPCPGARTCQVRRKSIEGPAMSRAHRQRRRAPDPGTLAKSACPDMANL